MNNVKENISKRVRTTLAKVTWKKVLAFFFFIVLATGLWFLQIFRQPFESTINIPIKYTNIPDSIFLENELPQTISVRIVDNGAALFRYFLRRENDTLEIKVGNMLKNNKNSILQNSVLEEMLRTKLFKGSEIKSYSPARISLEYAALVHKKVPVIFDGYILVDAGFQLNGDIKIYPDSVIVYGTEKSLKNIKYAYTSNDTLKDMTQPQCVLVNLTQIKNIRFVPSKVELEIPIDQFTRKTVSVPINCINVPPEMDIKVFPSNIQVSFFVGLTQMSEISENDFSLEIDCNDLKDLKSMITPVRLTNSPLHIHNITLNPSEVEFVFEKKR